MLQTFLIVFILVVSRFGVSTLSEGQNDPRQGRREGERRTDARRGAPV